MKWEGGFFDRGSFIETLSNWALTVITGRARLGGIPCGVIAVETRTVESTVPADPANPDTESRVRPLNLFVVFYIPVCCFLHSCLLLLLFSQTISQAGQVWYPNSAFKTAQAISDMDREGLPLFIFANWRGFSGGMRGQSASP